MRLLPVWRINSSGPARPSGGEPDGRLTELPTLIVACAAAAIVIISSLTALVAGFSFYDLLEQNQQERFIAETEAVSTRIEQHLARIGDIAGQITSRTKAREALEAYNNGLMSLTELREFSVPIIEDALNLSPSLIAIVRHDSQGRAVIQAGASTVSHIQDLQDAANEEARLIGPYAIADTSAVFVRAPIKDRQGNVVGTDAVAFDFNEVLAILRTYSWANTDQEIVLSRVLDGHAEILFAGGTAAGAPPESLGPADSVEAGSANRPAYAGFPEGSHFAWHQFARTNWLLTIRSDAAALYGPTYEALTKYALILISIIVLGGFATYKFLRPLADKVISLNKYLHAEVSEREGAESALARRVMQQKAVAEFGQLCLANGPMQDLLDHAARVTASTLQVEYCKILELIPERDLMLLRSGIGWQNGIVGNAMVPIDNDSQAGYTLRSNIPVVVEDLATEVRFSGPRLLVDHGVRSGISVIIDPANPWGVLGAHSTSIRRFTKDDVNFVQAVANCIAEVIERRHIEDALKASEERYRTLYDDTPAMFITLGPDLRIQSINRYGAKRLGFEADELAGKSIEFLSHEDDKALLIENLENCLRRQNSIRRWELRKTLKNGDTIWVRETVRVLDNENGEATLLIVCEDVSETRSLSERLTFEASHDPLTALPNRREFERRLDRLLASARDERAVHVLCYMDLDQFKVINDSCGHLAGDELLCQLANLLPDSLRKGDTVARLGGDEFGLLLENCSTDRAVQIGNAIREKVEDFRFNWGPHVFSLGMSIGLVAIDESSGSMSDILRNADTACYAAKDAGRNRIHVYQENDEELNRRHGEMQWIVRINKALEENQFLLFAQPIAPIQQAVRNEVHHELLIRLRDAENKTIPPGAFLPAAERYSQATKIDKWVVNSLFDYLTRYPDLPAELGVCSVNISGQSLADPEFLEYVSALLRDKRIAAENICFEITETAAISNLTNALKFIEGMKKHGCRLSLDDFGSGLSSFAYLKTLPVDYLKIDGLFVKDITSDPSDLAMVRSIHEIGKSLGKSTIAEFVENDEIRRILTDIGVDYAQGYSIGRPRPVDEFDAVRRHAKAASTG